MTSYRLFSMAASLPPVITERLRSSDQKICQFDLANNIVFGYYIAVITHHLPCIIIIFCYIRVLVLMRRRLEVRPGATRLTVAPHGMSGPSTSGTASTSGVTNSSVGNAARLPNVTDQQNTKKSDEISKCKVAKDQQEQVKQERKIFLTMSFILITFLICWLPFHIVHDLAFLVPDVVTLNLFTTCFWMAYANSALNPLIYAASNREIRVVMKRVIACKRLI